MRADNSRHLTAAATARAEDTRRRAVTAVRQLENTGRPLSIAAIAQHAHVSRSWLYTQPDLLAHIKDHTPTTTTLALIPARQTATDASLRQRLRLATDRIRQLENTNNDLRAALAQALGDQRTRHARNPPDKLTQRP